ncbi:MAG: hypothetical protein ACSLFB_11075 [Acidimicrobiales bacterium]
MAKSKNVELNDIDPAKEAADSKRRVAILLGIGVGLLAAAFFVPKLLFGGSDTSTSDTLTVPVVSSVPGAVATPGGVAPSVSTPSSGTTTTTVALGALPESYEVFATRNPFTPLVTPSTTIQGNDSTGTTVPGGTGSSNPSPPTTNGTEPQVQQKIVVLDVSRGANGEPVVSLSVDGVVYQLRTGDIFATNYKVVAINLSTGCADLLHGDEPFPLCRGQEIKK